MKILYIKNVFVFIAFQFFISCQTAKVEKKTQIEVPKTEKSTSIQIQDSKYFFLASDNLWVFFTDRFEIIKSPTEKEVVHFNRFEDEAHCPVVRPRASTEEDAMLGVTPGTSGGPIDDGFKDCIPRPPQSSGTYPLYRTISDTIYWVIGDEVVLQLGKQLYFFTLSGKFLRIENRKKGWQFEVTPYSNYDWRYKENEKERGFYFKGQKFEPGNPAVFSGDWVLRIINRGRINEKIFHLIDRSTAEYRHTFEATAPKRGVDRIEFREYGSGIYIDRIRTPTSYKDDIFYPIRRPAWWFGKTVIDLENNDPATYCYVYKEKKKCIPIPTPCTFVDGKKKCIPLAKRPYPAPPLRGVLETEKMLVKVYDDELAIEFKTKK